MAALTVDPFITGERGRRVLPSFSLAEQKRRYDRVRELMHGEGLDCILAPGGDGSEPQAPSRYLCQVGGTGGGAWVVRAEGTTKEEAEATALREAQALMEKVTTHKPPTGCTSVPGF